MLMLCVMMLALQRTGTSAKNPGGKGVKRKCSICSGAHMKSKCPTLKRDQQQCSPTEDGIGDEERLAREDADCVAYGAPLERDDGEDADKPKAQAPPEGSSRCPSLKPDDGSATHEGIAMPKWRDILLDGGGPVLAKAGCSPDVGIKSGVEETVSPRVATRGTKYTQVHC